ncbi:16S rRNA (cytosine(1402)-N(4))-methyltransferase RsmH [Candidatus Pacebacteria bacterium]|nr:16S rRNA (cytosine(1402)-N(4))-methyltransferase RsmH [Candidatus Paceibacterota bacterium]
MKHVTVLLTEAVGALCLKEDSVVVDCTFGSGGHAKEILSILGKGGTYIGIDADETAFIDKREEIESYKATTHLVVGNFRSIVEILDGLHITNVDAMLADLGWRTEQFMDGKKGFSFSDDSTLLMTYGDPKDYTFTAHTIVNEWEEENIADVIYGYGEERGSRRIAKAIVDARENGAIDTSLQLAEIVKNALPSGFRNPRINPATKTFQALRIAVNDELGAIESLILNGFTRLTSGGRFAIISFHSIEDRIVKQLFKQYIQDKTGEKVTKKPITPEYEEIKRNPRARSAKLRIIEKI